MKTLFIETKYEGKIRLPGELLAELPQRIMFSTTVQFVDQIPDLKKQLEETGKTVFLYKSMHGRNEGQMLGCDVFDVKKYIKEDFDVFLYVGDGVFHPTALLYENEKDVWCYDPFAKKWNVLDAHHLDKLKKKRKGAMLKFLSGKNIGILITLKPGQHNLSFALDLKKQLEAKGKTAYLFVGDTLDMGQLENYPFMDCWVNTACPRIIEDTPKPMVNMWDLKESGYYKGEKTV